MNLTKEEMLELAKKCGTIWRYNDPHGAIIFPSETELLAYTSAIEEKYQERVCALDLEVHQLKHSVGFSNDVIAEMERREEKYQARIQELEMQSRGNWIDAEQQAQKVTELQAQVAILWNALRKLLDDTQHNDHDCGDGDCPVLVAKEALTATQQSSDAFIAEVKAGLWRKASEICTAHSSMMEKCAEHADQSNDRTGGKDRCYARARTAQHLADEFSRYAAELRNQQEGKEGGR